MLALTSLSLAAKDQLYGLSLVKNPPTRAALNTVSAATNTISKMVLATRQSAPKANLRMWSPEGLVR